MKYLNIYQCCYLTVGYSNSLIVDVERNLYVNIPNSVNSYIHSLFDVTKIDCQTSKDCILFLIDNHFLYVSPLKEEIQIQKFESPYKVEDLIVDMDILI